MVQRVWVKEGVGSFLVGDVILSSVSQLLMPQNVALLGWICGYRLRV
jgi:hypothetical protein